MNVIPTRTHAVIDYIMAAVLILTPFVFQFAHLDWEMWVLIYAGVITLVSSLLTHDELGIAWAIPMPGHLALDVLVGAVLIASPWLFGFANDIWWPHVILGAIKILVALATRLHPRFTPGAPAAAPHTAAGQH
jgi:hypothetical protein